jgi:hypothetical protein
MLSGTLLLDVGLWMACCVTYGKVGDIRVGSTLPKDCK